MEWVGGIHQWEVGFQGRGGVVNAGVAVAASTEVGHAGIA